MTPIVLSFQRAIYGEHQVDTGGSSRLGTTTTSILPDESVWWYFRNVAVLGVVSVLILLGALWLFGRLEGDFAEEL
jgi:ABC-2 type transport system permease protein